MGTVTARLRPAALPFLGIALPLFCFAVLAARVSERRPFAWDLRVLHTLHGLERTLDLHPVRGAFFFVADFGLVVLALVLVPLLAARRRGAAAFYALCAACVLAIDQPLKDAFRRPALIGFREHHAYIFPSGHAMGSMAVAASLAYVAWPTRWRARALAAGSAFVLAVGVSVVVFGAHYPTDVLAGWCLALAIVTALRLALPRRLANPYDRTPSSSSDSRSSSESR